MGNYCYVAVCSTALGASAPTEGGEGRGHIVAAAHLELVILDILDLLMLLLLLLLTYHAQHSYIG